MKLYLYGASYLLYDVLMVPCRVLIWSCAYGVVSCVFEFVSEGEEKVKKGVVKCCYLFGKFQQIILKILLLSMLSGSLVTTAWRVLRLRMEEKASRYGG
jgi:hypothetical protein